MQDPAVNGGAAAFQLAVNGAPQFPQEERHLKCPRCESTNTKFCYYNNYNLSQPRHFCKDCRRYWTKGGALRKVPVGGATRKTSSKRSSAAAAAVPPSAAASPPPPTPAASAPPPLQIPRIQPVPDRHLFFSSLRPSNDPADHSAAAPLSSGAPSLEQWQRTHYN
ncbi:unnamed protein product [Spirodela intermedia]|uniref:Dof zinc finger protein n=1 Tax=Spirodela intermedia TaxID=51605 RepID=A0A7I8LJ23_SPIIN|nr:unnamed protein product [Spirodela intermedia]